MENKKNNTDIFEMVNNHDRQEAIRWKYSEKRKRDNLKILNWSIIAGTISLFFGLVGVLGGMAGWIAYSVFSVSGVLSAFLAGRWFENGKCLGWK